MMTCQICGDTQGPWEYTEYISANGKPWLIENRSTVLACEECAKILKKRIKQEQKQRQKDRMKWYEGRL